MRQSTNNLTKIVWTWFCHEIQQYEQSRNNWNFCGEEGFTAYGGMFLFYKRGYKRNHREHFDYCKQSIPNLKKQNKPAYRRMVFRKCIATDTRVAAFQLRRNTDMSMRDIAKTCGISTASVQRILTGIPRRIATGTKQMGHPHKLSVRQQHLLVRNLRKVREQNPTFHAGIWCRQVVWTVQLFPREQWIAFFRARVSAICRHEREACWKKRSHKVHPILLCNKKSLPRGRLNKASSILLGWGSFTFKTDPQAEAKCHRARIWRQHGKGLSFECTGKGSRRPVKLFLAITYGEGVILCESYERLTGTFFAELIEKHFNSLFDKAKKMEVGCGCKMGILRKLAKLRKAQWRIVTATHLLFKFLPEVPTSTQ